MPAKKKRLRSGYTTGACAAAAAKAATAHLLGRQPLTTVEIPFPDGSRHGFVLQSSEKVGEGVAEGVRAAVVKDAGDDPDVTNGAVIGAVVQLRQALVSGDVAGDTIITLRRGPGVGLVTKPGLPVAVGEPAINPGPQRMIEAAVAEALRDFGPKRPVALEVTIFVEQGTELATKTLNHRLGIVGGLSILGTTGIVRPVSAEAWTATIEASLKVAAAAGLSEVVLSTGRTSEAAVAKLLQLPEEGLVMMGDYLEFALRAAAAQGFAKIHLAGMWAKIVKAARQIPQTHVRHGALEARDAVQLLARLGLAPARVEELAAANTAREIYLKLRAAGEQELIHAVCAKARDYAQHCCGLPVVVYLVSAEEGVVARVG